MNFMDAFDKAEPAPKYKPLPAGVYAARIVSGAFQTTKKGADAYRIAFEVTEGEFIRRRVSRTWVFTDKAVAYAKRDLADLGLKTGKQLLEPWPPFGCEIYCRLIVAIHRGDDGTEFNDIKRIDNIRIQDSNAKPFLIDPDADASEGGTP